MKYLALILAVLLLAIPAWAERGFTQTVLAEQNLTTAGGAVAATLNNPGHESGYLIVTTSDEVNTASLAITVDLLDTNGAQTQLCALTAITTETVTLALLGSELTAGEGITDVCDFPMPPAAVITFTVTGTDAELTTEASMYWLPK